MQPQSDPDTPVFDPSTVEADLVSLPERMQQMLVVAAIVGIVVTCAVTSYLGYQIATIGIIAAGALSLFPISKYDCALFSHANVVHALQTWGQMCRQRGNLATGELSREFGSHIVSSVEGKWRFEWCLQLRLLHNHAAAIQPLICPYAEARS